MRMHHCGRLKVLKDRVPVIDRMWQTETGGPIEPEVVTPEGQPCAPGEKGIMVLKRPFPGLTPHPAVAEAGVTGRPDEVRSEVISAFVVLKQGHQSSPELKAEVLETIRREFGPVVVVGDLNFVNMLPKTRSGKIMRRVLKAVTLGKEPGDIATIEDEGSVEEARHAWEATREQLRPSPGSCGRRHFRA